VRAKSSLATAETREQKVAALRRLFGVRQHPATEGARDARLAKVQQLEQNLSMRLQAWTRELGTFELESVAKGFPFELRQERTTLERLPESSVEKLFKLKAETWSDLTEGLKKEKSKYG
jgi:hypothetical protein